MSQDEDIKRFYKEKSNYDNALYFDYNAEGNLVEYKKHVKDVVILKRQLFFQPTLLVLQRISKKTIFNIVHNYKKQLNNLIKLAYDCKWNLEILIVQWNLFLRQIKK